MVGNNKLQENVVYIRVENIEINGTSDWFRKREHIIGCMLTCTISKKASVHKQIEGFRTKSN